MSKPQQIAEDFRAKIASGHYQAGALLPSRLTLAGEYGVALSTIETAVKLLREDGVLRAENGRGTFVAERGLVPDTMSDPHPIPQGPAPTSHAVVDHTTVVGIITQVGSDDAKIGSHNESKVITNSLERAISKAGATSHVLHRDQPGKPPSAIEDAVKLLQADGVDGLIFLQMEDPREIVSAFALANQKQIPAVFINMKELTLPVPSVYCGNRDAGYQAADHLLQRGCRDLLFFAPYSADWVDLRLAGAQEAIFLKGLLPQTLKTVLESIDVAEMTTVYGAAGTHETMAYRAAQRLLAKGLPAEGVIAANDGCAVGFYQAATEAGYVVGRDYALVGFDDLDLAQQFGITSLHPPLERLGQEATQVIIRAITDGYTTMRTSLNFNVVARRSSQFQKRRQAPDRVRAAHPGDIAQSSALY